MMRSPKQRLFLLCLALLTWMGGSPSRADGEGASPGASPTASWLAGAWSYRIPITVKPDSIQGTGPLIDFSLHLKLGPAHVSVFTHANANGSDLLITKGDGTTPLGHEIVSYNAGTKQAELWFRADTLSKTVNTFYLYYGNPLATTFPPAGAAWNSKYLAVYHFSENPGLGVLKDWGPHANNGNAAVAASNWTASDTTAGQIGQAWKFNGITHFIPAFSISTPDTSYVISAWVKLPSRTTDFIFQSNPGYWHVSAQINDVHRQPHFNAANPWRDLRWVPRPLPDDDLYHHFTWVFDGEADTISFYFDGIQQPATPWSIDPSLKHFYTGFPINPLHNQGVGVMGPMYWNQYDLMTGPGDEFRLSERTHSASWIRTEYRNQRDASNFFVFGAEEPGGLVPVTLLGSEAVREQGTVDLWWRVASSGDDISGFHVYRDLSSGSWVRANGGIITGGPEYTWVDAEPPLFAFTYRLLAVSRMGETSWIGPIPVEAASEVASRLLALPNPFHDRMRVEATVPQGGRVRIRVIDMSGREVRSLYEGITAPGRLEVIWDGRDGGGRRASSGAYLIVATQPVGSYSKKVLLLPE